MRGPDDRAIIPRMEESPRDAGKPSPTPAEAPPRIGWEVLVVVLLTLVPWTVDSFALLVWPRSEEGYTFLHGCLVRLVHYAGAIALVLFVIRRNGEPWRHFGLGRSKPVADGVLSLILVASSFGLSNLVSMVLAAPSGGELTGLFWTGVDPISFPQPVGSEAWGFCVLELSAGAFAQEMLLRGYLLPRLATLLGSVWKSLLATSVLFAIFHTYQGLVGVSSALVLGLLYGGVFCLFGRIWPVAAGHAVYNTLCAIAYRP